MTDLYFAEIPTLARSCGFTRDSIPFGEADRFPWSRIRKDGAEVLARYREFVKWSWRFE